MSNIDNIDGQPTGRVGAALLAISRLLAIFGGVVLCAMAVLTTISVTGRSLSSVSTTFGPIMGDFELIGIGTGVAVFAFLPYCQIKRANVLVDFFLVSAPARVKASFDVAGCLIYGVIMVLFSWRTTVGGIGLYEAAETTYMLGIPRWWTFPLAIACLVLLVAVCGYTLVRSIEDVRHNRLSQ